MHVIDSLSTGCPISKFPLCFFFHFLGFWSTYRGTSGAIIRCPHNLKNFFAGIPQGPLETSPGTIKKFQKRFQGPPARGF